MKIQLTSYGKTTTVEWDHDEQNINDVGDAIEVLMLSAGFHPDSVIAYFVERADEIEAGEGFNGKA